MNSVPNPPGLLPADLVVRFAIGLHAQSRFPGVYEWDGLETAYDSAAHTGLADDATPSFTNWSPFAHILKSTNFPVPSYPVMLN